MRFFVDFVKKGLKGLTKTRNWSYEHGDKKARSEAGWKGEGEVPIVLDYGQNEKH